jgi:hypothetical protein
MVKEKVWAPAFALNTASPPCRPSPGCTPGPGSGRSHPEHKQQSVNTVPSDCDTTVHIDFFCKCCEASLFLFQFGSSKDAPSIFHHKFSVVDPDPQLEFMYSNPDSVPKLNFNFIKNDFNKIIIMTLQLH